MRQRWKHMKRWKKWTTVILGSLLLIIFAATGFIYYQINQIDLEDIQQRVEERQKNQDTSTDQSAELPGVLSGTVDKANTMASKPIDSQDALDVAAILLKSGLNMKEIYYLLGKSTDQLSNEEKQRIRDLLLAKLTDEEIKALRAITQGYGKGLIILDPNYPIELVGVYDESERERIKKELEEKKRTQPDGSASSNSPSIITSPVPSPSLSPKPSTSTVDSELHKQTQAKLEALQQGCASNVSSILNELAQSIQESKKAGKDIPLESLQNIYLPQIVEAESKCDGQFNQLMTNATQDYTKEGYPLDDITVWRKQYENSKEQARNQAMAKLMTELSR